MKSTTQLHSLGQSLWLDNITRELLNTGTLRRYITEFSVTGLTSNPTIFDQGIRNSTAYDHAIHQKIQEGKSGETLFFELALEDLMQAAALFRPVYEATGGRDGWVSLEVSPLLVDDVAGTIKAAKEIYDSAHCANLFIKIPGTSTGIHAVEELIFAGVPVNVTLLFSCEQYVAAADAYCRGIQRRIDAGLSPKVNSVASIFVSRWDTAVRDKVPIALRNCLGVVVAERVYKTYCERLAAPDWLKFTQAGALAQGLLWASTGTKDTQLPETFYIEKLAAPNTINTMPEKTLHALAAHTGSIKAMQRDDTNTEFMLAEFERIGIDTITLATQLQREGIQSFTKSWRDLIAIIALKGSQ